jgi:hypothetical protein
MDRIIGPSANKFNAKRFSDTTEYANCEILISKDDGEKLKKILIGHNDTTFKKMTDAITINITNKDFTSATAKKFFENLKTLQQQYENDISGDIDIKEQITCNLFENNKYNKYTINTIKKSLIGKRDTVIVSTIVNNKQITKSVKFDKICIETDEIKTAREKHNETEDIKNTAAKAVADAKAAQKKTVKDRDEAGKAAVKKIADATTPQQSRFTNPFKSKTAATAVGGGKKRHSHRHHQKHNIKSSDISICE